jgi:hypothetical protein
MMTTRVPLLALGLLGAGGLIAPSSVFLETAAPGVEISRSKTEAVVVTSAAGARAIELEFTAELINGIPDLMDDVEVGWRQVGGVEPQPFRVLMPAGCFVTSRRGSQVEDFDVCGVQIAVNSSQRGRILMTIVDFEAKGVARDDGIYRFDILATFVPPDPIHEILGILGGAAVQIATGSGTTMPSLPLRTATVSGVDPQPF